jgi:hypothetical protein
MTIAPTRCPHCERVTRTTGGGRCPNCAGWKADVVPVEAPVVHESLGDVVVGALASVSKAALLLVPGGGLVAVAVVWFDVGLLTAIALVAALGLIPFALSMLWDGWSP